MCNFCKCDLRRLQGRCRTAGIKKGDKMKKTSRLLKALLLLVCCMSMFVMAGTVSAAEYKVKVNSNGTATVTNKSSGKKIATLKVDGKGEKIHEQLVVTTSYIYFTTTEDMGDSETECCLYRYKRSDKSNEFLVNLTLNLNDPAINVKQINAFDVNYVYSGSVYLTGWSGSNFAHGYRYALSERKLTKIANGGCSYRFNQYIVCDDFMVHGDFSPAPVYVYNTRTGVTKTIAKQVAAYNRSGKYVFAAVMRTVKYEPGRTGAKYDIIRYNLSTGGTVTLASNIKAYSVQKITGAYVYQLRYVEEAHTKAYYRYNMKTKKNVKITAAKFKSVVGFS